MAAKTWILWGVAVAGALAITYTFAPQQGVEITPAADRAVAPNFTLKDSSGAEVHLADYAGKVVLLNFWATWCVPCRIEIPWFIDFEEKYKDQGFAVLGVDFDSHEEWEIVKPYMAEQKMNYQVVLVGDTELPEPYYSIEALPTTLLIDRAGHIAATHNGLVSKPTYEEGIKELLAN
jgi:cytochrome c biogenesis protein CcmG/thiol:disulfide interchange protein DsbE